MKISNLVNEVCSRKGITNIKQIKMPIVVPAVNIYNEDIYIFTNVISEKKAII